MLTLKLKVSENLGKVTPGRVREGEGRMVR